MERPSSGIMRAVVVEPTTRQVSSASLVAVGVAVIAAVTSSDEAARTLSLGADVFVVDFALPGFAAIDVIRELRSRSAVPIVVLGAGDTPADVVMSLEAGADDFVREVHGPTELLARVRAAIRRRSSDSGGLADTSKVLYVGDLTLDRRRHEAFLDGAKVHLSPKEFDLLVLLVSEAGSVVRRTELIDSVWGSDYVGATKTLDTHIKRLRAKLEVDPAHPARIITVRGRGFLYDPTPPTPAEADLHVLHS